MKKMNYETFSKISYKGKDYSIIKNAYFDQNGIWKGSAIDSEGIIYNIKWEATKAWIEAQKVVNRINTLETWAKQGSLSKVGEKELDWLRSRNRVRLVKKSEY
jgi:hypothetical protein